MQSHRFIYATFIGQSGSLGYITGQKYRLKLEAVDAHYQLVIRRTDGTGFCPYANIVKFLENWDFIENEQPLKPNEKLFLDTWTGRYFTAQIGKDGDVLTPLFVKSPPDFWKEVK